MKGAGDVKPYDYSKVKRPFNFMYRFLIGRPGDLYLDRLELIRTPWFSLKLHRIHRPDRQGDLHDHPWDFLAIILKGKYIEDTPRGYRMRTWFNWKRAEDRHAIRALWAYPVWTLVFCGPKRRTWGFWLRENGRFMPWREYEKLMDA